MPPIRAAEAWPSKLGVGGQVEVEQQRLAVVAEQDVGRLEVAMEDAALVGVGQPVGQAGGQPEDRLDVAEPADALELGGRPDLGSARTARDAGPWFVCGRVRDRSPLLAAVAARARLSGSWPGRRDDLRWLGAEEARAGVGERRVLLQLVEDVGEGAEPR